MSLSGDPNQSPHSDMTPMQEQADSLFHRVVDRFSRADRQEHVFGVRSPSSTTSSLPYGADTPLAWKRGDALASPRSTAAETPILAGDDIFTASSAREPLAWRTAAGATSDAASPRPRALADATSFRTPITGTVSDHQLPASEMPSEWFGFDHHGQKIEKHAVIEDANDSANRGRGFFAWLTGRDRDAHPTEAEKLRRSDSLASNRTASPATLSRSDSVAARRAADIAASRDVPIHTSGHTLSDAHTTRPAGWFADNADAKVHEAAHEMKHHSGVADHHDAFETAADAANRLARGAGHGLGDAKEAVADAASSVAHGISSAATSIKDGVADAAKKVFGTAEEKVDDAKWAWDSTKHAAKDKARDVSDKAAELAHDAKDKTSGVLDDAAHKVKDAAAAIKDKAIDAKDAIKEKVSDAKDAIKDKAADAKATATDKARHAEALMKEKADEIKTTTARERARSTERLAEEKESLKGKAADAKDLLRGRVSDAREAIKDKATDTKEALKDKAGDAKDAIKDKAMDAKDAIKEKVSDAKDAIKDKAADVKDAFKDRAAGAKLIGTPFGATSDAWNPAWDGSHADTKLAETHREAARLHEDASRRHLEAERQAEALRRRANADAEARLADLERELATRRQAVEEEIVARAKETQRGAMKDAAAARKAAEDELRARRKAAEDEAEARRKAANEISARRLAELNRAAEMEMYARKQAAEAEALSIKKQAEEEARQRLVDAQRAADSDATARLRAAESDAINRAKMAEEDARKKLLDRQAALERDLIAQMNATRASAAKALLDANAEAARLHEAAERTHRDADSLVRDHVLRGPASPTTATGIGALRSSSPSGHPVLEHVLGAAPTNIDATTGLPSAQTQNFSGYPFRFPARGEPRGATSEPRGGRYRPDAWESGIFYNDSSAPLSPREEHARILSATQGLDVTQHLDSTSHEKYHHADRSLWEATKDRAIHAAEAVKSTIAG